MSLLLAGLAVLGASGVAALGARRGASILGAGGAGIGCLLALVPSIQTLMDGSTQTLRAAWDVPFGSFFIELDPLSAFFLLPILGLSALSALYGVGYLSGHQGRRSLGPCWLFYNLLVASMVLVVVARNAVLFLSAWEIMALASFFLVTFEDEQESVRQAGWIYLVATHVGTAFLLALFVLMGRESGSLDFDKLGTGGASAGLLFLLAIVGFGTKAGFMPLHVWLPEAHPAAPSHVSAVMSGVMIKTGIYGLIRIVTMLGTPPAWWGWVLVGIGATSGVLGVLFALAQRDIKRVLAYSSVENIGVIALGLGVGVLGLHAGSMTLVVLGFAGALLHVVNHAMFKGLLFLGAGAVLHASGTREIDQLGGLLKRMRWTGLCFLIGSAAISGLPPLNGFVGEFLIYLGAWGSSTSAAPATAVPMLAAIAGLVLIGGLAVACFTRAFGIVFLGEPRTEAAAHAHEPGWAMRIPMLLLAAGCLIVGFGAPFIVPGLSPVVASIARVPADRIGDSLEAASAPLVPVAAIFGLFAVLVAGLTCLRARLLSGRTVEERLTWDCGYARPTPKMQYTGSSFAQPLTDLFALFLGTRKTISAPRGYFPREASLATETPDACRERMFRPAFSALVKSLSWIRWLQHGRVQLYVLYIAVTLLILLVWKLG